MYDPEKMKEEYDQLEHGKTRMSGIRCAIEAADRQNDLPFQLYFRLELCRESTFYDDALDLFVIFPEALALVDKHPDIPSTYFDSYHKNGMTHVLWVYKWVIENCIEYYQIPLADCKKFFEDYKKRSLAFGYNLKPYYLCLYDFYKHIDEEYAKQCFHKAEALPRDRNANCRACERNGEVEYYLTYGNLEKANNLSREIDNFTLTCGSDKSAWLRLKSNYMTYYLDRGEFEQAEAYCRMMERNLGKNYGTEYEQWEYFLYCYTHTNIGKALKIYKEHWKEWLCQRCPQNSFDADKYICAFFQELERVRKGTTVKLNLGHTFPLYQENGQYKIAELFDFYYKRALNTAEKFDERNGTDYYKTELKRLLSRRGNTMD